MAEEVEKQKESANEIDTEINPLITDPDMKKVIISARQTHKQALDILDAYEAHPVPEGDDLPKEIQADICRKQKLMLAHLTLLRGQYRKVALKTRATKQATLDARAEVDDLRLQLQNLYYEQAHVEGEIAACENYEHYYQTLDMIPEEEFLELKPEFKGKSEEEIMSARITHEYEERLALHEKEQALIKRKEELIAANKKKREDMANTDKEILKFLDAAEPLDKKLQGKYDAEKESTN